MIVALLGLMAAATLPVSELLRPEFSAQTVRRFSDGDRVTLEGWIIREPERRELQRTYLYVDVQNGAPSELAMTPATGLVRITAVGPAAYRVGDQIRVSGKIRFPRNEGDEDEFDYRGWLMRHGIAATLFCRLLQV
jgi:Domain of unknown function (DUF4131)